jgi:hypothetical protein
MWLSAGVALTGAVIATLFIGRTTAVPTEPAAEAARA